MKKSILIFTTLLAACASNSSRLGASKNESVVKSPQVLAMEQKEAQRRARDEAQQDQKDRNRILSKKAEMSSPKNLVVPPVLQAPNPNLTDRQLYGELVGSYERNNEIAFSSRYQAFMAKYPRSPLADDAVYLAGLMALANKNYGPALKYMNTVLQKYPSSNKTSAAMFAKGVALKKMNLVDEAKTVFAQVQKKYPGSPESLRASSELKILNQIR